MALSATTLLHNLTAIGPQTSPAGAASAWRDAFFAYVRTAQDVSGDPLISGNLPGFYLAILSLFGRNDVSPDDAAKAFGQAFVTYWTGATFSVAIPVAPGTKGTVGAGTQVFMQETSSIAASASPVTLVSQLTDAFATPSGTADDAMGRIAEALHRACTSDVSVLITGIDTTPTGPLPVTNTNKVH